MSDIKCFNIETGEFEVWDHYALCGRGMPDGWGELDSISKINLVNEIRRLKGLDSVEEKSNDES